MRYRKNKYFALLNTVDDAIRKTVYKTAPDVCFNDQPSGWVTDNVLNGGKTPRRQNHNQVRFHIPRNNQNGVCT